MKKIGIALLCVLGLVSFPAAQPSATSSVLKLDPALDAIISPDAKLEIVKEDYFGFIEGPVWILADKFEGKRLNGPNYQVSYHGVTVAHMDAWCHIFENGQMYNGVPVKDNLTPETGCKKGSVMNWKDGSVTRAVLYDIAQLKGVDWVDQQSGGGVADGRHTAFACGRGQVPGLTVD